MRRPCLFYSSRPSQVVLCKPYRIVQFQVPRQYKPNTRSPFLLEEYVQVATVQPVFEVELLFRLVVSFPLGYWLALAIRSKNQNQVLCRLWKMYCATVFVLAALLQLTFL
jgi:hypothetical protein